MRESCFMSRKFSELKLKMELRVAIIIASVLNFGEAGPQCDVYEPVTLDPKECANFTRYSSYEKRPNYYTYQADHFCFIKSDEALYGHKDDNLQLAAYMCSVNSKSWVLDDDLNFLDEIEELKNSEGTSIPDQGAENPYFVDVSGVSLEGYTLRNWLHFRIFMNLSTNEPKERASNNEKFKYHRATGYITAAVIMVKDQNGWPIGDFWNEVPCRQSCSTYGDVYVGERRNNMYCSYTPPRQHSQPSMFIYDANPGSYDDERGNVQEVHATWSFSQDTCNFVTELHIQAIVFESVAAKKIDGIYGYPVRYNILLPTASTLGAPDYVDAAYWRERNQIQPVVNCHIPFWDSLKTEYIGIQKGPEPSRQHPIPFMTPFQYALAGTFKSDGRPYFGQPAVDEPCRHPNIPKDHMALKPEFAYLPGVRQFFIMKENKGIRCPCPSRPTYSSNFTLNYSTIFGRLMHATQMSLAYMVLFPLACFIARYCKETFVTVFCFEEHWWYMCHVVLFFAIILISFGSIICIVRQKVLGFHYEPNLSLHVHIGYVIIMIVLLQIATGFHRFSSRKLRMVQIFFHWFLGALTFLFTAIAASGLTCEALIVVLVWLVYLTVFFVIMEFNARNTDKKMALQPRRSYLPPPVVRLFIIDAPGRMFRTVCLLVFTTGLLIMHRLMAHFIWNSMSSNCGFDFWGTLAE